MGATGVRVTEYDQTKAMENADLIIANCFANGRAVDDDVAVIFDVTKLEEYGVNGSNERLFNTGDCNEST